MADFDHFLVCFSFPIVFVFGTFVAVLSDIVPFETFFGQFSALIGHFVTTIPTFLRFFIPKLFYLSDFAPKIVLFVTFCSESDPVKSR